MPRTSAVSPTPASSAKVSVLVSCIEELRRTYDHVSNIYDQLRVKALALIAGEVAIAAFIFGSDGSPSVSFTPQITYGQIFFYAGVLFLCVAFGFLLSAIATLPWKIPVELRDLTDVYRRFPRHEDLLEYVKAEYTEKIQYCIASVSPRARRVNWAMYLLSAGVIILLVIKFGS